MTDQQLERDLQQHFSEQLHKLIARMAQTCEIAGLDTSEAVNIVASAMMYELIRAAQTCDLDEKEFTGIVIHNYRLMQKVKRAKTK